VTTKIKSNNITAGSITADLLSATAISDKLGFVPASGGDSASAGAYANTAINNAASASLYANTSINNAASASVYANTGITLAQAAYNQGNSTATVANTKFSSSGGTISGTVTITQDLNVTGNIFVSGNTTSISANDLVINDSLIYMANNNAGNLNDIGLVGHFTSGKYQHTGIVRDHTDATWKFFSNVSTEPTTTVNFGEANTIYDGIKVGSVISNGVVLGTYVQSAYDQANTAFNNDASSRLYANTGINNAASASLYANTGINNAASASAYANSAVRTVTGTSNQITASGTTAITLSTPQNIHTGANFQVNSLGVGTAASGTTGEIRATNDITAFYSDDRLKTKLGTIENALDKLCTLSGFYYEPNQTAQDLGYEIKRHVGVSAQEVQSVMPEVVKPAPISDQYLTVQYEKLVPLLIQAIKELKAEVDSIKGS
jgi:hypothetical protein